MTRVVGLSRLEALYKTFVGLDLDKTKAQMILDTASRKLADLFIVAQQRAYARGSDTVELIDLPITKGLENTINEYKRERERLNDPKLDLGPILDYLAESIPGILIGESVREELQDITAAVLLLTGRVIKTIDPKARKPSKEDIERARQILDLTL